MIFSLNYLKEIEFLLTHFDFVTCMAAIIWRLFSVAQCRSF